MAQKFENIISILKQDFAREVESIDVAQGELTVTVNNDSLLKFLEFLKNEPCTCCEQLIDLCGVDYGSYGATEWETTDATSCGFSRGVEITNSAFENKFKSRFAVVYHLLSLKNNLRIRVKYFINEESGITMT